MKPYYEHAGITIYNADCRDILPQLEDGSISHVITDPPYNAGKNYGAQTNDKQDWPLYCDWLLPIIAHLERISSGLVMLFLSVNGLLEVAQRHRPIHVCVWDKPMSFAPRLGGSPFLPHWEPCLIYGKSRGDIDYNIPDVWHCNTACRNGHPCPKPLSLMRRIIRDVPGELFLDSFCGSGTTLEAAKILGRRAIGIEIEEKYCEIAAKRLAQEVMDFK